MVKSLACKTDVYGRRSSTILVGKKMSPENTDPKEKFPPGRSFTATGLSAEGEAASDAAAPSSSKMHGTWHYQ